MDPVATNWEWGSNYIQTISNVCPVNVCSNYPEVASHSLAVLSNEPVTIRSLII